MALVYQKLRRFFKKGLKIRFSLSSEFFFTHDLKEISDLRIDREVEVRELNIEETKLLREVWPVNILRMQNRILSGESRCYGTFVHGKIVGYHWVQFKGKHFIQQLHQHIHVLQGDFWVYHVRLAEEAQGKGIGSYVYSHILKDFKAKAYNRAIIYTAESNVANQKSLKKVGFKFYSKVPSLLINEKYWSFKKIHF